MSPELDALNAQLARAIAVKARADKLAAVPPVDVAAINALTELLKNESDAVELILNSPS